MRRLAAYEIRRGDNLADPSLWNGRFDDLDLRIHSLELATTVAEDAAQEVISVGLQRLNETFGPLIQQSTQSVQNAAALLAQTQTEVQTTIGNANTAFTAAIAEANADLVAFIADANEQIALALAGGIDDGTF